MDKRLNQACFHCGAPVPEYENRVVEIDGTPRSMCCPGCEAVAQTIVASGLSDYYRSRDGYANTAEGAAALPPELLLYDAPEVLEQFAPLNASESTGDSPAESTREAVFSVEGIRCAACVWLIERRLARLPGVAAVNLNVATERLHLRWNDAQCKPSQILGSLGAIGYTAHPFDPVRHDAQMQQKSKTLFRQLFIAGLSMMQVMMYAFPAYVAREGDMDFDMRALMNWAGLLLTIPAVFYSALPFFRGAWANLRAGALGMDVPVALGIAAAFVGSVVATISGEGEVYYDSVTMFIFLLLCSRYLELMARRKAAGALERLQHGLPASATRLVDYPATRNTETIPAARLAAGDHVLVKPGEPVAADCVIVEGATSVDLSLLTGESLPQHRAVGDTLPGGAVNAAQPVVARVVAAARESTLSVLVKLVERAGQDKPQLALWADRVAAWFVAGLLLFAAVVFALWQWIDPSQAWPIAIAVLVVSCPCALSMATPSALAAATDRLVRQGVLAVRPHVIETLHRVTHVVFDKTGTLTSGKPVLRMTHVLGGASSGWCLQAAAALEQGSAHPLAQALVEGAMLDKGPALEAQEIRHEAGRGVEGLVGTMRVRLGSAAFVAEIAGRAAPNGAPAGASTCKVAAAPMELLPLQGEGRDGDGSFAGNETHPHPNPPLEGEGTSDRVGRHVGRSPGNTQVYLGVDGEWLACFELADTLRPEAPDVVRYFREHGKQVVLLSGDEQAVAASVAAELGIAEVHGGVLPHEKLAFVQGLQARGGVVAMVGDGINDAAVLRGADVSFAMSNGATLAQTHADAVLLSPHLSAVTDAAQTAAKAMNVIRQNLFWASVYNVTAIPAAALGWINPWMAGVGMAASSALVVLNALRLRRLPRPWQTLSAVPATLAPQGQAA